MIIRNVSWTVNPHIRMISGCNDCWELNFAITGINYLLKCIQIEKLFNYNILQYSYLYFYQVIVTWHTAKYGDPYSEFVLCIYPSKVHTHTHREHTHTHQVQKPGAVGSHLCCDARGAVVGSVSCSRAPRCGIEGGESAGHSLPPPTIPAGPRN